MSYKKAAVSVSARCCLASELESGPRCRPGAAGVTLSFSHCRATPSPRHLVRGLHVAEMLSNRPIFPGKHYLDQLNHILGKVLRVWGPCSQLERPSWGWGGDEFLQLWDLP